MSGERARRRVQTPLGTLTVTAGPDGVRTVTWGDGPDGDATAEERDPDARRGARRTADAAADQLVEYLRGERRAFDLVLSLPEQPPFRRRVLEELARIPYGETVSYGHLAARCGRPNAARAVGNAVGRNPVPVLLPCHRVIRADGSPGEYGGGRQRKRELLDLEGALAPSGGPGEVGAEDAGPTGEAVG